MIKEHNIQGIIPAMSQECFDCSPALTEAEIEALQLWNSATSNKSGGPWPKNVTRTLERLIQPIRFVIDRIECDTTRKSTVVAVFLREMHGRGSAYWGWSASIWLDIVHGVSPYGQFGRLARIHLYLIAVAYVCGGLRNPEIFKRQSKSNLAYAFFGKSTIDSVVKQIFAQMEVWKIDGDLALKKEIICEWLLLAGSGDLRDVSDQLMERSIATMPDYVQPMANLVRRTIRVCLGRTIHANETVPSSLAAGQYVPLEQLSWPFDLTIFDRAEALTKEEYSALTSWVEQVTRLPSRWPLDAIAALDRLIRPLSSILSYTQTNMKLRSRVIAVLLHEMHARRLSYWGWSDEVWGAILRGESEATKDFRVKDLFRQALLSVAYLLGNFTDIRATGQFHIINFATTIFGQAALQQAFERVEQVLHDRGYRGDRPRPVHTTLAELLLAARSSHLEDITQEIFLAVIARLPKTTQVFAIGQIGRALHILTGLNFPEQPVSEVPRALLPDDDVHPLWFQYCTRWHNHSTLVSRDQGLSVLYRIGRWIAREHPELGDPLAWDGDAAALCVAAIRRMRIGEFTGPTRKREDGARLSSTSQAGMLSALSSFFQYLQHAEIIPVQFDARRSFSLPSDVKRGIKVAPRTIPADVWGRLLWAATNLTDDDLPHGPSYWYPVEMVQAIGVVWLLCGLRSSEVVQLRMHCVKWENATKPVAGTNTVIPPNAVCYLHVHHHKTSGPYEKPVDPIVGQVIQIWQAMRPKQRLVKDERTEQTIELLFMLRDKPVSKNFVNNCLIPILCNKAGIPLEHAREHNVVAMRARSTMASMLASGPNRMSLIELQKWLNHCQPETTRRYVEPNRLINAVTRKGVGETELTLTVAAILDHAAATSSNAPDMPWIRFDLGDGWCQNATFSSCQHRLACARCKYYQPKEAMRELALEAERNYQHMLIDIELTEDERLAVTEGIETMRQLCEKLQDTPTPDGRTPREIAAQLYTTGREVIQLTPLAKK